MDRKSRVQAAFSAAAPTYLAAAQAQEKAARLLAARLGPLRPAARVLELGCGAGLLTRMLLERLGADASLLASDLSPAMIDRAQAELSDPRLSFRVLDAESPEAAGGGWDLIVSSLAAQWFADLPQTLNSLAGLLAPGGRLLIATLGDGTFSQWRAAHAELGYESGTPDYPDAAALAAMLPGARVEAQSFQQDYPSAKAFLASLAATGADTPKPSHKPLSPGRLRKVMAALGSPCSIAWDILFLSFTKDQAAP